MINISVVLPVYNAEKYLSKAIESILRQSFKSFELIIVNDGSTDNSLKIINSFSDSRIVLIDQHNAGLPKALNNGIRKSKSDIIARMDSDDISLQNRLEIQYNFLIKNQQYIIVGSNAEVIDADGRYVYTSCQPIEDHECKNKLPATPFFHPSVMFRKEAYSKAGYYNEKTVYLEDVILFNRMAAYGKFYNFELPLLRYRIVPNSNSLRSNRKDLRAVSIIDEAINNNNVSDKDYDYLKYQVMKRDLRYSQSNYYLLLGKKYLWNNHKPKLARMNLVNAFRLIPSLYISALLIASFLPSYVINKMYILFKSLN
jgi:glycosyltransferase involved in cell wall biosynthesis